MSRVVTNWGARPLPPRDAERVLLDEGHQAALSALTVLQRTTQGLAENNQRSGRLLRSYRVGGPDNVGDVSSSGGRVTMTFGTRLIYGRILETWLRPAMLKRARSRRQPGFSNPRTPNPFAFVQRGGEQSQDRIRELYGEGAARAARRLVR